MKLQIRYTWREVKILRLNKKLLSQIDRLIASASAIEGTFFRTAEYRYSNPQNLLNGDGTRKKDGRFAPIGKCAVYLSSDHMTSIFEATARKQRLFGRAQIELAEFPCMTWEIKVSLSKCVNLADRVKNFELEEMISECLKPDLSVSQRVGQYLLSAGVQGIIYPSCVCNGTNLVVFPDSYLTRMMRINNVDLVLQEIEKWLEGRI